MDHLLYSVARVRAIEAAAAAQLEPGALMARAGASAGAFAFTLLADTHAAVLVLAGPGNNGGDALEAAAHLADGGAAVHIVHIVGGTPSPEAAQALARAQASPARFIDDIDTARSYALVVDGLFGIGLARALAGRARDLVGRIAAMTCPVLALDVPSGLDADTGTVVGPDGMAVRATHTLTFLGDKPGLHTGDGGDYAGRVRVDELGTHGLHDAPADATLITPPLFAHARKPRRLNSHKGSFGDVAVLGGAHGMAGAAMLSARAALYAGGGRIFVAAIDTGLGIDPMHPEIMFRPAEDFDFAKRTTVAGPGLGDADLARHLLAKVIAGSGPLLLDADALNLLARHADLHAAVAAHDGPLVMTPHPLEAARLLGVTAQIVGADRLENAREIAQRFNATVVLKGAGSIVARPDGTLAINTSGNPGLATGGSGDVLSGLIGALLAQGWPAWEAALGGVWLHGAAADRLVAQGVGPIGLTAGELPAAIRAELNALAS